MKSKSRIYVKRTLICVLAFVLLISMSTTLSFGATAKVKSLSFAQPTVKTAKIVKGKSYTFKVAVNPAGASKAVTWKTSNKKVATVSAKGVVKAKKAGTVKITAISKSNKKAKVTKTVKVVKAIKSIKITAPTEKNITLTASAAMQFASGDIVNWKSSDANVATVDKNGLVSAVAPGTATITAVSVFNSKAKATVAVTVQDKYTGMQAKIDAQNVLDLVQAIDSKEMNPDLGFRLAGSDAEKEVADLIYNYYTDLGLSNVTMDPTDTDAWHFTKGRIQFGNQEDVISAYQTNFITNGLEDFDLVWGGRGLKDDLDGIDVAGKVVLINTDSANEFWINHPAYEAVVAHGARGIIACEDSSRYDSGLSMLGGDQIQDNVFEGPADVGALSCSQNTRNAIFKVMDSTLADGQEPALGTTIPVKIESDSEVIDHGGSQNVWAEIPGKSDETIILMAHFDSYFRASIDNADGDALLMTVAKAIKESGIQPEKTIRFVHHGAEEWGIDDSYFNWAVGAYEQIFKNHPEWQKTAFTAINVDSFTVNMNPVITLGKEKTIRMNAPQLDNFLKANKDTILPEGYTLYNDTVANVCTTGFEDFAYMVSGIPKILFYRSDLLSQGLTYHSTKDNYESYCWFKQDELAGDKVAVIANTVLLLDSQLIQPVNYTSYFEGLAASFNKEIGGAAAESAITETEKLIPAAQDLDAKIVALNGEYAAALAANDTAKIAQLKEKGAVVNKQMFALYKQFQKGFTRLNLSATAAVTPHSRFQSNIQNLMAAKEALQAATPDVSSAIESLMKIDQNDMAYDFSKATYNYAVDMMTGTKDKTWATGLIENPNQNLYNVIQSLKKKETVENPDVSNELSAIDDATDDQASYLNLSLRKEVRSLTDLAKAMQNISAEL